MKKLKMGLTALFALGFSFLLAGTASAGDIQDAARAYVSLQQTLSQAAPQTPRRSVSKVFMNGYVVSGTLGLVVATEDSLDGPLGKEIIQAISSPLYEEETFGLYDYQGYKVQVWYEGGNASVILMMTYTD